LLGHVRGLRPDQRSESLATLERALDLGVTLLDTSMSYGGGDNERLLARVLGRLEVRPRNAESPANARLSGERLMGFEPTTFCMASNRSAALWACRQPHRNSDSDGISEQHGIGQSRLVHWTEERSPVADSHPSEATVRSSSSTSPPVLFHYLQSTAGTTPPSYGSPSRSTADASRTSPEGPIPSADLDTPSRQRQEHEAHHKRRRRRLQNLHLVARQ
jgi:hypothetical protein